MPRDAIWHGCGAWWTGRERGHCGGCHLTFSSRTAFDRHRRRFRCVEPSRAGLVGRPAAWGVLWGLPEAFDDRFERMLEHLDAEDGVS
ncbi:FDXHR family putative zinc-binding protein [Kitasatospora sp. NPDC054939]